MDTKTILIVVISCHVFVAHGLSQRIGRQAGSGPRCYECSGVTDLQHCTKTVQCAADQECHTEMVVDDASEIYFNSGCQPHKVCQLAARGKRSELHLCEGCCGTDLCNNEICHHPNSTKSAAAQCYQCNNITDPLACSNKVTCAAGEQCIVKEYADDQLQMRYDLGCQSKMVCDLLQQYSGKRNIQVCNQCCHSPGCNRHLCVADSNSTASSVSPDSCVDLPDVDCKLANDSQSICEKGTLAAKKYCRKFCGYCLPGGATFPPTTLPPGVTYGTTEDPCKDSGDIDCKDFDQRLHICANKQSPPTVMYCPKYCGICTPATPANDTCFDEPGVDCKQANDSQNICSRGTLAATKYCRKFCGYCLPGGATFPPTTLAPGATKGTTEDPCKDSGDIDCKDFDTRLHICANKQAPPTVLYCPKYCGLC